MLRRGKLFAGVGTVPADEGRVGPEVRLAPAVLKGRRGGQGWCEVRQPRALCLGHGEDLARERAELIAQETVLVAADSSVGELLLELGQLGAEPPIFLSKGRVGLCRPAGRGCLSFQGSAQLVDVAALGAERRARKLESFSLGTSSDAKLGIGGLELGHRFLR